MAKGAKPKGGATLPAGTPVTWAYRGTHGHGRVVGVATKGSTPATTRYKVRQVDHHVSASGSHEKPVVIHTGAALSRTTPAAVTAAAAKARKRKKKG